MMRCARQFCAPSNMNAETKIGRIACLIEAMLDFALIVGFLSAGGLLISNAARGVF